jgi:predicted glycosyltransferase
MKKRLMFYCQSLLGIGHFVRSRELVLALLDFDVCFVYGGEFVPGFELPAGVEVVYLPALKSDEAFSALHVIDGALSLESVQARRKAILLSTFDRFVPDVLVLELFPFGRKHLSFELLPLLEHAQATRPSVKVVCSLRDILVRRRNQTGYEAEVCALMNQYFDLLLIHADPQWQRLEETFASLSQITCAVRYTGYVVRQPQAEVDQHASKSDSMEPLILASIGGGRVGHELIECALAAECLLTIPHRLHVIAGPHIPEEQLRRIEQQAASRPQVTIQHYATELLSWMERADLSISLAGYNTCMEILSAGVRALVYPFTGHGNDEQTLRASKLEASGLIRLLDPQSLNPEFLAAEIEASLALPRPTAVQAIDLQGAAKTARLLAEWLEDGLSGTIHGNRERQ